jgi:hypothetical protein
MQDIAESPNLADPERTLGELAYICFSTVLITQLFTFGRLFGGRLHIM